MANEQKEIKIPNTDATLKAAVLFALTKLIGKPLPENTKVTIIKNSSQHSFLPPPRQANNNTDNSNTSNPDEPLDYGCCP